VNTTLLIAVGIKISHAENTCLCGTVLCNKIVTVVETSISDRF